MEEKETFGIPSSKIYRNGEVLDLGNIPYFLTVPAYSLKLEVELSMQKRSSL